MKEKSQSKEFIVNRSSEQGMPKRNISHPVNLGVTEWRVSEYIIIHSGNFQPFSCHGIHKLISKILWHTKK